MDRAQQLEVRRIMHQSRLEPGSQATVAWLKHRMDKIQQGLTSASTFDDVKKLQGQFAECKSLLDCFERSTFNEAAPE